MTEISKLVKRAKVGVFLLAFVTCVQVPAQVVYAGDINSEETRLLELIQQTFTYEGKTYQVSDSYIEMTREYLLQDEVNFTAGEVDQLLSKIKSNVATGVAEGYLYEVGLEPDNLEDEDTTTDEEESKEGVEELDPKDLSEEDTTKKDQEDKNVTSELEDKNVIKKPKESNTQEAIKKEDSSVEKNTATQKVDNETIDDKSKENPSGESGIEEINQGEKQAEENETNDNQVVDGIIKNTGFSIHATIIMGGAIMFFLIIGVTIAHRVSQFANDDDE